MTQEQKLLNVIAFNQAKLAACKEGRLLENSFRPRTFEQEAVAAQSYLGGDATVADILTEAELLEAECQLNAYRKAFNDSCKLSGTDIKVALAIGAIGFLADAILVGVPEKGSNGIEAGCFANALRNKVTQALPEETCSKLVKEAKVTYDLTSNVTRNASTKIHVEGLSAYYHRLLSLGHDASGVGRLVGIYDILKGSMTTIDKDGHFVSQVITELADRKETDVVSAFVKYVKHLLSDITTNMGLPAPYMSLFNLVQIGSFFEDEKTVAELVQEMYWDGYDLIHFTAANILTVLMELVIRVYAKVTKKTNCQCENMRFLAHTTDLGLNMGVVCITENISSLNYSEVLSFARCMCNRVHWIVLKKSDERSKYICNELQKRIAAVYA